MPLRCSERNSIRDRREAAKVLAAHLVACVAQAPDAQHFVIAHSHGGNIAAMAFTQLEAGMNLKNIHFAALSTPFIWFHNRGLSPAVRFAFELLLVTSLFLSPAVAVAAGALFIFLVPYDLRNA